MAQGVRKEGPQGKRALPGFSRRPSLFPFTRYPPKERSRLLSRDALEAAAEFRTRGRGCSLRLGDMLVILPLPLQSVCYVG